jgi:hypothetical protein
MSTAVLARPATTISQCRFPDWCNSSCEQDTEHVSGERNHWSTGTQFWAYDVDDERIAVELYDYENTQDGVDPVRVYLAAGDDNFDEDGCPIPAEQARKLGILLTEFSPDRKWLMDAHIYTALDTGSDRAVIAEYRRERLRRDGNVQDEHVEVSIRPSSPREHSIRVRLSMSTAGAFGRCLVTEADRADASNRALELLA